MTQYNPPNNQSNPLSAIPVYFATPGSIPAPIPVWTAATNIRTVPLRVATFGDSTADGTGGTVTNCQTITQTFAAGGSLSSTAPEKFSLPSYYHGAYLVANGGFPGQTTAQMLARETQPVSTTRKSISDILNLAPDLVLLRAGSINDFAGMSSSQVTAQIPVTYANHIEIINRLLIAGVKIIDRGIYGYSGTAYPAPSATRAACVQLDQMYAAYAAQFPGQIVYLSPTNVVVDSSANFLPNCALQDGLGVHLSLYGESLMAPLEAACVNLLFGPSTGPRYGGFNLMQSAPTVSYGGNSLFASVAGNNIPAGLNWEYNAGSTSQVYSIDIIGGRKYASMASTPNAVGNYIAPYFDLDGANFSASPGDVIGVEFDIIIQSASGGAPPVLSGFYAQLQLVKTAGGTININFEQITQTSSFGGPFYGKCITIPFVMPADTTTFSEAQLMAQVISNDAVTPWKVSVTEARLVKIGSGGVINPNQLL